VWFSNCKSSKVKTGLSLLLVPIIFYVSLRVLLRFGVIPYDEMIKGLYDYGKYFWSIVEFIGIIILIRAYSSKKEVTTALLLGMTGATLGIFIVLGDGFVTELAAFAGYLILLISLFSLKTHTNGSVDAKRLRIAALIAVVGMLVNMIPFMEWLGTVIEVIAYIIAISGYLKLHKSRGLDSLVSGFGRGAWAMALLLLATLIHAIPSFGIGEAIAAMLGLLVVVILTTAWIKSLAAIKTEAQLNEDSDFIENKQPVKIEALAEIPKLLKALNLSQLAFLTPTIILIIDVTISASNGGIQSNTVLSQILYFTPFGVILPAAIWMKYRNQFSSIDMAGRMILNFQLTMFLLYEFKSGINLVSYRFLDGSRSEIELYSIITLGGTTLLLIFNLSLIVVNTIRCNKQLMPWYQPAIPFFKINKLPIVALN